MSDISIKTRIFLILAMSSLFSGCKKEQILSGNQQILFQVDYTNAAWGEHSGFFIDNKGNVITYKNPEEWNNYDNLYNMSDDQLTQNLLKCKIEKKVPEQDLQRYSNYIKNIASSKVSARRNVANNAGKTEFICYRFSESTGNYQGYLIKLEGDYTSENLNFYSRKVTNWLRHISETLNP